MSNPIVENFKAGYIKCAVAKGFSAEEANSLYSKEVEKYAEEDDFKHTKHDWTVGAGVGAAEGVGSSLLATHGAPKWSSLSKPKIRAAATGLRGLRHGAYGAGIGGLIGTIRDLHDLHKKSNINTDYQDINSQMGEEGMAPAYNTDDASAYSREYNNKLLQLRDKAYQKDPTVEALKAALRGGTHGGFVGFGLGHAGGHLAQAALHPNLASRVKNLPGWGRGVGVALGALAGGVPAAMKAKRETEAGQNLVDPNVMQHMMDQLSKERQLSNNQIGTYRPIPITPQA